MTPIAQNPKTHENPMPEKLKWIMSTNEDQPVHLYETPYGTIETVQLANWKIHEMLKQVGKWLIRKTSVNGKTVTESWHGPFSTEKEAVASFLECHAPIEITNKDLEDYKKNDYWGRLKDGTEAILVMDKWTGGTVLTTNFIVVKSQKRKAVEAA